MKDDSILLWPIEAEWRIYASAHYANIGSDNFLSPGRRQATVSTDDGLLLIGTLATYFNEIWIK